jgi:hypothetical protein
MAIKGVLITLPRRSDIYVGDLSNYAAFDGENIWITLPSSSTVIRLRASDGALKYLGGEYWQQHG